MALLEKYKTLIFDFDGVIASTDAHRYELLLQVLRNHQIRIEGSKQEIVGMGTKSYLKHKIQDLDESTIDRIVHDRRQLFFRNIGRYSCLYPGAKETLHDLKTLGIALYLATTNDFEMISKLLSYHNLDGLFREIFSKKVTEDFETSRKTYRPVLEIMGVDSSACLVIEDSPIGVLAAKKAGLFCIGFDRLHHRAVIDSADIVVHDYAELRNVLGLRNTP